MQYMNLNRILIQEANCKKTSRDSGEVWTQAEYWHDGIFINFHRWMAVLWFCRGEKKQTYPSEEKKT